MRSPGEWPHLQRSHWPAVVRSALHARHRCHSEWIALLAIKNPDPEATLNPLDLKPLLQQRLANGGVHTSAGGAEGMKGRTHFDQFRLIH